MACGTAFGGGKVPLPFTVVHDPVVAAPLILPFKRICELLAQTEKSAPAFTTGFGITFTSIVLVSGAQPVEGSGTEVKLKIIVVKERSPMLNIYVAEGVALLGKKSPVPVLFQIPTVYPEILPFRSNEDELVQTRVLAPGLTIGGSMNPTVILTAADAQPTVLEPVSVSVMVPAERSAPEGV